jgi:hypothetical protein
VAVRSYSINFSQESHFITAQYVTKTGRLKMKDVSPAIGEQTGKVYFFKHA